MRKATRGLAAPTKTGGRLEEAIRQQWAAGTAAAAEKVAATAARLFQAIRAADYNHDWTKSGDWEWFPAKDVVYDVNHNMPGWVRWVCKKFKANPITDVRLGKVFPGRGGAPTVHFELRLKQGQVLQGDLPFRWDAQRKQWIAEEGLDWHLHEWPWDDWWDKLAPAQVRWLPFRPAIRRPAHPARRRSGGG